MFFALLLVLPPILYVGAIEGLLAERKHTSMPLLGDQHSDFRLPPNAPRWRRRPATSRSSVRCSSRSFGTSRGARGEKHVHLAVPHVGGTGVRPRRAATRAVVRAFRGCFMGSVSWRRRGTWDNLEWGSELEWSEPVFKYCESHLELVDRWRMTVSFAC